MVPDIGACGGAMVVETSELGVAEAKENGEDSESTGPSGKPLQALDWRHKGNVYSARASCKISEIHQFSLH